MMMRMMTMLILEYPKNMGQVIVGGASTSKGKTFDKWSSVPKMPNIPIMLKIRRMLNISNIPKN